MGNDRNRPNVVFCLLDQCRIDMLDAHPVFERLKEEGVFCENVFSYAPYTIASMHALFSGVNGRKNGVDGYYKYEAFKADQLITMPEYFQSAGYRTIGDFINPMTFPKKGWDVAEIHDEFKDDLTERHNAILKSSLSSSEPTFTYLHYSTIHTRMVEDVFRVFQDTEPEYFSQQDENRRRYREYVVRAGCYLSAIWESIKESVYAGDTIFQIMTDHGCSLGEKWGERAYGVYTFDYTLHLFSYIIAPRLLPTNKTVSALVRSIDVLPTLLNLLNIPIQEQAIAMDGTSFLAHLRGDCDDDRTVFSETGGLGGPFPSHYGPNVLSIRTRDWKLIYYIALRKKELFDLSDDPQEQYDRAAHFPDKVRELWSELIRNLPEPSLSV